jgi:hypothetical protein
MCTCYYKLTCTGDCLQICTEDLPNISQADLLELKIPQPKVAALWQALQPTENTKAADETIEQGPVGDEELRKLWRWYRYVDMQQVTHIGADETGDCWQKLSNLTSYSDLRASPEHQNLLVALHFQYDVDGFIGRAKRMRKG